MEREGRGQSITDFCIISGSRVFVCMHVYNVCEFVFVCIMCACITLLAALRACSISCRILPMFSEMFGIWAEWFCSLSSFFSSRGKVSVSMLTGGGGGESDQDALGHTQVRSVCRRY